MPWWTCNYPYTYESFSALFLTREMNITTNTVAHFFLFKSNIKTVKTLCKFCPVLTVPISMGCNLATAIEILSLFLL